MTVQRLKRYAEDAASSCAAHHHGKPGLPTIPIQAELSIAATTAAGFAQGVVMSAHV